MKIKVVFISVLALLLFCYIYIYGQGASTQLTDKYNPGYHFYPSIDPTGLFFYGGQYFLNWGSATSKDLVHWKMTPYGLSRRNRQGTPFGGIPGQPPAGGIPGQQPTGVTGNQQPPQNQQQGIGGLSGSAVVDWDNSTGLGKNGNLPLIAYNISPRSTYFFYSNDTARTWIRNETPAILPNSSGSARDPKLFWYEPDKKWVMLMPWCEIQEIRFFSSKNLVDWEYMSKFGPWGAVGGQWECVDFFPLAVDGDQQNIKWVLVIGLQPRNGQYFIGDFDGRRFTMDESYIDYLSYDRYKPSGIMLFDNPGWEKAFWFDWGQDFYAQRTWTNYAPDDKRMIVVGWMGNWRYNNEPILGNFSIPRSLELKTLPAYFY